MTGTATTQTSVAAVATQLVALCRTGGNMEVIDRFYSPDIVSIESAGSEEMPAEMHGIDSIRGKNSWWMENNEIHSAAATGPFIHGEQFAVKFDYDTTFKPTGQRSMMTEMALYDVANGKIVREQFFYNMPGK
ncbi:MAG: nuclear transport factor 2 family protein [Gemmatimonadaceae bacterium]